VARDRQALCTELLAQELAISKMDYCALEIDDSGIWEQLTIRTAQKLSRLLGTRISAILSLSASSVDPLATPDSVLNLLLSKIGEDQVRMRQAEIELGIDLQSFVEDPLQALEWNLAQLISLAEYCGESWPRIVDGLTR
jgi:hypothetical protein